MYISIISFKQLEDFVTKTTLIFFIITGISGDFLKRDVDSWEPDDDYKSARITARSIRVVNEIADRGVALMEAYNQLHSSNEEQKQYPQLQRGSEDSATQTETDIESLMQCIESTLGSRH